MTAPSAPTKKLASIVAIDVAGYSRQTEADEDGTIKAVAGLRERISEAAKAHGWRVFNTAGDGFMLEFPTASGALAAAEEIAAADDPPVRVGVHLGEVIATESGDLLGHGVNVAARIQQMASAGAILVSGDVKRAIRGPLGDRLRPQGSVRLDKMSETLPVFALAPDAGGKVRGRRLKLPMAPAIAAVALLALAGLGAWVAGRTFWAGPAPDRIAIVPFSTLGGGDEVRTFAAGLTDDLASVLSGNGRPIVSGQEAQALTGPGGSDLVHKLGVRLVFGGSVEREADKLKVRVHLDDAQHAVTLWTAAMDAPVSQAEALQGQLGARVIAVLNCTSRALRPEDGLTDPDAMTLLLKACDVFESQVGMGDDASSIYALLDTSRQLVAKAPGFAAGHSLLAKFAAFYRAYLPPSMNDALVAEARTEIQKALRLDPGDIDAHVALYLLQPTGDIVARDKAIMGVPFDPSWPYGEIFKAIFLQDVGRLKDSLAAAQRAEAANPLSTDADTVINLAAIGQTQAAEQDLARLSRLWPPRFFWLDRLVLFEIEGNWAALTRFLNDPAQRPEGMADTEVARYRLVFEAARTRSPAALASARAALLDVPPGAPSVLGDRAITLAWLGYVDDAFALAARVSKKDLGPLNPLAPMFMPQARAMRRDPRFMALAARLGLVDYWSKTGNWPDFCSEPGLPYDCKAQAAKLMGRHP